MADWVVEPRFVRVTAFGPGPGGARTRLPKYAEARDLPTEVFFGIATAERWLQGAVGG
jgi:hypothetical protein